MQAEEIEDEPSLRAWLEALPQSSEADEAEARRWAVAPASLHRHPDGPPKPNGMIFSGQNNELTTRPRADTCGNLFIGLAA